MHFPPSSISCASNGRFVRITALVVERAGGPFVAHDLELDEPREDELLVRIEAVGVCHTDIGVAAGYLPDLRFPVVLGHEGAGVVEAVGSAVHGFTVGDHVVLCGPRCGTCRWCAREEPAYCENADALVFGCSRSDGTTALRTCAPQSAGTPVGSHFFGQSSFATHVVAPSAAAVRIADDIPLVLAAPLGCGVATGWGTVVRHLGVQPGDSVVIVGTGGVGMASVCAAVAVGAEVIVALEPLAAKRELALALGATHVVDTAELAASVVAAVRDNTNGGADHVVCTIGDPSAVADAVAMAGRRGTVALIGGSPPGSRVAIDANDVLFQGKRIHGVRMGDLRARTDVPLLVDAWRAGRLPLERLITTAPLASIDDAIARVHRGDAVKAVLLP